MRWRRGPDSLGMQWVCSGLTRLNARRAGHPESSFARLGVAQPPAAQAAINCCCRLAAGFAFRRAVHLFA